MNIPTMLYGNYNDVLKRIKILKKECKSDVGLLSEKINLFELQQVNQGDLIIMEDNYTMRKVNNSFFPFAFSNVILFEQEINISPIVTWYKNIALTEAWLLLTLIANCSPTKYLFNKPYSIKVLDAVVKHWEELLSPGTVYLNELEHCFTNKTYINYTDGQYFWKQNFYFKKLLFHAGVSSEVLNDENTFKNFNEKWDKLKSLIST
jgi:hypothetical protein